MLKTTIIVLIAICSVQSLAQQTLPFLEFITIKGDTISSNDLAGKNVYFNIWETWCGSCLMEFPILNYAKENLSDVIFLSITPSKKSKVLKILEKRNLNTIVISDANEFCEQIGVTNYPSHFLLDTEGTFSEFDIKMGVTRIRKEEDKKLKKLKRKEFDELLYIQNKDEFINVIKKLKK